METDELTRLLDPQWASTASSDGLPHGLARRVAHALRTVITSGMLPAGARLPSERRLAVALCVSRPTVTTAIDELKSQGLLESRQGSGTWVCAGGSAGEPVPTMAEVVLVDRGINLAAATPPDASHLGSITLDLGDLLAVGPAHGYDPSGIPELRAAIAGHIPHQRRPRSPEEIIVTPGAHASLALCIGAFVSRGERVIVERYTYGGVLDLLSAAKARPIAVERDEFGTSPEDLDNVITGHRPAMVYLMPSIHAPTGTASSASRLHEIAAVLDRHEQLVVADEVLADLTHGSPAPRLASMCSRATVIEIGSLSKVAWGGLRVGWLSAEGHVRERLAHHRSKVELGTSIPSQLLARTIFERIDDLVDDRRRSLRASESHMRELLTRAIPEWEVAAPAGGLCHWVRLPLADSGPFVAAAARYGVAVMAGAMAAPGDAPDDHIRVCFDRTGVQIDEGVARLAAAWRGHDPERG